MIFGEVDFRGLIGSARWEFEHFMNRKIDGFSSVLGHMNGL